MVDWKYTNETKGCYDIAEILLKVVLKTLTLTLLQVFKKWIILLPVIFLKKVFKKWTHLLPVNF